MTSRTMLRVGRRMHWCSVAGRLCMTNSVVGAVAGHPKFPPSKGLAMPVPLQHRAYLGLAPDAFPMVPCCLVCMLAAKLINDISPAMPPLLLAAAELR
jgi:hypothetical protein